MEGKREDYEKLEKLREQYEKHQMTEHQKEAFRRSIMKAKKENRQKRQKTWQKTFAAAAAAVALFILLPNLSPEIAYAMSNLPLVGGIVKVVTFRDYQYETDRHNADITVPELTLSETEGENGASGGGSAAGDAAGTEQAASSEKEERLQKTTDEINEEIRQITDEIIAEFEAAAADEEGYQDVMVKSEILATADDYFTLKLICYQASGSGAEWDYFYTIDLNTGERLALADLFADGADYITPVSENIKEQMKEQMAADEMVAYWVDNEDVPEWNFERITDETSFYLNQDGNLVICFNEGDVAPMYMGCVEFVIPDEVIGDIRK